MTSYLEIARRYEDFYNEFRRYLWPYNVLEDLANVETGIYTAFTDVDKLKAYIERLKSPIKVLLKDTEDEKLKKTFDSLYKIISELTNDNIYAYLRRVEEVNPGEDKQIKSINTKDEQEHEQEESESVQRSRATASYPRNTGNRDESVQVPERS